MEKGGEAAFDGSTVVAVVLVDDVTALGSVSASLARHGCSIRCVGSLRGLTTGFNINKAFHFQFKSNQR